VLNDPQYKVTAHCQWADYFLRPSRESNSGRCSLDRGAGDSYICEEFYYVFYSHKIVFNVYVVFFTTYTFK
jgi:hypothetical protein